MKKLKIQSISDIITNSSSEVYIEKIDDYGLLDKVLETMGIKDNYTYFKTEEDVKNWFIKSIKNGYDDTGIWHELFDYETAKLKDDTDYPYNVSLQCLNNYYRKDIDDWFVTEYYFPQLEIDDPYFVVDYDKIDEIITNWTPWTVDQLWEKHKQVFIDNLLGYAICYMDRDDMYTLERDHSKEIHKIYYEDSLIHPIDTKDKFCDMYKNIINIGDYVIIPAKSDGYIDGPAELRMAKVHDIKLRIDGKYDIVFEIFGKLIDNSKFVTYTSGRWIMQALKEIPNKIYGTVMHEQNITEEDAFQAAHEKFGYSKLSSEHVAFVKGVEWAKKKLYKEIKLR